MTYITKDGETLDYICWKYYGRTNVVEQVLQANRHLAKLDAVLPGGGKDKPANHRRTGRHQENKIVAIRCNQTSES